MGVIRALVDRDVPKAKCTDQAACVQDRQGGSKPHVIKDWRDAAANKKCAGAAYTQQFRQTFRSNMPVCESAGGDDPAICSISDVEGLQEVGENEISVNPLGARLLKHLGCDVDGVCRLALKMFCDQPCSGTDIKDWGVPVAFFQENARNFARCDIAPAGAKAAVLGGCPVAIKVFGAFRSSDLVCCIEVIIRHLDVSSRVSALGENDAGPLVWVERRNGSQQ